MYVTGPKAPRTNSNLQNGKEKQTNSPQRTTEPTRSSEHSTPHQITSESHHRPSNSQKGESKIGTRSGHLRQIRTVLNV